MAKMFGCSGVIAHGLVSWFEQTGISIDAQDTCKVRKQSQGETVNLHSRIDISSSSRQHLNVSYQWIKTRIGTNDF